jgi:hypothetical protein
MRRTHTAAARKARTDNVRYTTQRCCFDTFDRDNPSPAANSATSRVSTMRQATIVEQHTACQDMTIPYDWSVVIRYLLDLHSLSGAPHGTTNWTYKAEKWRHKSTGDNAEMNHRTGAHARTASSTLHYGHTLAYAPNAPAQRHTFQAVRFPRPHMVCYQPRGTQDFRSTWMLLAYSR